MIDLRAVCLRYTKERNKAMEEEPSGSSLCLLTHFSIVECWDIM